MKLNEKGMTIPNMFLAPFHGTRQEALEAYHPEKGEFSFPEDEFWEGLGEQDWLGLVATREEIDILQKVLKGDELTDQERDLVQRFSLLISVAWKDWDGRRDAV